MKCDYCKKKVKTTITINTDHPFSWLGMGIKVCCIRCFLDVLFFEEDKN